MPRLFQCTLSLLTALALAVSIPAARAQTAPPVAPVRPVSDTYFGKTVVDPYRWMENLSDPEVVQWFKGQSDYAQTSLNKIPNRDVLLARIKSLDNAGTSVADVQIGGSKYFYLKTIPGFNSRKLYVRDGLHGAERLLFDPETLSKNGVHYSIDYYVASWDGARVAYALSPGGSEDSTISILETATGKTLSDHIDRARFGGVSWNLDNRSFYYNRLKKLTPQSSPTELEQKSRVYLHVLGSDPDTDTPVFGYGVLANVPIAENDISVVSVSAASPYLFGLIEHGVQNELTLYAAPRAALKWHKIVDVGDDVTGFDARGDTVYLLSHKGASRFKILRTSISHPDMAHAAIFVPPGQTVLTGMGVAQDALYVVALDGGLGRLLRVPYSGGSAQPVSLPYEGTVGALTTNWDRPGPLFLETSWTHSALWYAYDPKRKEVADTGLKPLSPISFAGITSAEVKARSADGTLVPLSIVYKKGLPLDGSHPTLLDGYGAYGHSTEPFFYTVGLAWLERGGVLAFAHVRGGGEYGEDWHLAGKIATKHHTWEDFIACGQYLVDHKFTSPTHLSGSGTSAGGITIGRAITARPDLFGAALIRVGVSNPLRQELSPNGPPNIPEFGSFTTPSGFQALSDMDAYHHVQDGVAYPAVLVETGINDPRVASWEPAKMAARLQAATTSGKPVLLRVDYDAGHGMGSTRSQSDALLADEYAFLFWQLGNPDFQPPK